MFLNKKEQTLFCLLYPFDFNVVFSSAFSVISTTVRVIMNPPIKNILSILSPPNAKKSQPTQNRLGKILYYFFLPNKPFRAPPISFKLFDILSISIRLPRSNLAFFFSRYCFASTASSRVIPRFGSMNFSSFL